MNLGQLTSEAVRSGAGNNAAIDHSPEIRPPSMDEKLVVLPRPGNAFSRVDRTVGIFTSLIIVGTVSTSIWYGLPGYIQKYIFASRATTAVVDRIIHVESNGCTTAANDRSTATGPAQFIEETWLRLIRKHRPDLAVKPTSEIMAMRSDPDLSREMAARFAEQNARVLHHNGIAVTPGSLYLSHFAGVGGAVAILSAPDAADAAMTMANADSTGRSTRDRIVDANPFLDRFTIADLKKWADRKMRQKTYRAKNSGGPCPL